MSAVNIKGSKDGVKIYIESKNFDEVKKEIIERIQRGIDFFQGSSVILVDPCSMLSEAETESIKNTLKEMFNVNAAADSSDLERTDKVYTGIYEGRTKFYKNTIRSGQKINYNGNIVVIGDVNSGAEIAASGNIVVLGALRGVAHAGSNGNRKAFVAAYALQASQLRISDIIARAPDEKIEKPKMPEVAKVKDNVIVIEPYLPNKYI